MAYEPLYDLSSPQDSILSPIAILQHSALAMLAAIPSNSQHTPVSRPAHSLSSLNACPPPMLNALPSHHNLNV